MNGFNLGFAAGIACSVVVWACLVMFWPHFLWTIEMRMMGGPS